MKDADQGSVGEVISLLGAVAGCDYFREGISAFGAKKVWFLNMFLCFFLLSFLFFAMGSRPREIVLVKYLWLL